MAAKRRPISRPAVRQEATGGISVRWSRPGLDRVRKGRGRAVGFHKDGSLMIIDDDGKIRAIAQEFTDRRTTKIRPRSKAGDLVVWTRWSDADNQELVQYVLTQTTGDPHAESSSSH